MNFKMKPGAKLVRRSALAAVLGSSLLAACGGGNGSGDASSDSSQAANANAANTRSDAANAQAQAQAQAHGTQGTQGTPGTQGVRTQAANAGSMTHADAFRLLTQATFGPTDADVAHAMSIGAAAWIDEQLAKPVRATHLARWNADNLTLSKTGGTALPMHIDSSFFQEAVTYDDQLRQRVTYALSEILVISTQNLRLGSNKSQSAAGYLDMLANNAFGNYRNLLQNVTLHPAMGQFLSMMASLPEDPAHGRIPDQNYAREVMQLFSIGLYQLNLDGTVKVDGNGQPIPTYGPADIDGLSRVFTGFSWGGPDTTTMRFNNNPKVQDPNRLVIPMQAYAQFHSLSEKRFLGAVVPAQQTPDPMGSLKVAMDTLFNHPNVGPFISKQLIQRLVTSNPSPAYVARVASVFNDNGSGVRGDLKAVVRAILLDNEARDPALAAGPNYGKLREPVLRLTAWLRAYPSTSDSGEWLIMTTDDPGLQLNQSALRARSVFNFFRPGYVPSGGQAEQRGLVLPEMQITSESSVAGYANYMINAVPHGVGWKGLYGTGARPDVQVSIDGAKALAGDAVALVDDTTLRLIGDNVNAALKTQIVNAVNSIAIPPLKKDGSNLAGIDKAKQNRAYTAVTLTLASPEFLTQR